MSAFLPHESLARGLSVFLIGLVAAFIYFHENDMDHLLGWAVKSEASTENFTFHTFQKGPFSLALEGQKYLLSETFSGTGFEHPVWVSYVLAGLLWIGLCGILVVTSYWRRYGFLVVCGLMILLINFMDPDAHGLLGSQPGNKWLSLALMVLTLAPTYYFHAFRPEHSFLRKWAWSTLPSLLFLIFLAFQSAEFVHFFIANTHPGIALLSIVFILIIAEEVVFLILFVITSAKGGTHNERHLIVFGLAYLIYLALYFGKRTGLIGFEVFSFDPIYLLLTSTLIATWSIRFKQTLYDTFCAHHQRVDYFFLILGLITYCYLQLAVLRGNDPAVEALRHISLYAHLGFGFLFLLYILVNFMTPLMQGLAVFKIVYSDQNFPYISARLGGLVAAAALFFYADRVAMRQVQGARYNYLGDLSSVEGESTLADEYYRMGSVFAWDNHYSNYQLGMRFLQEGDLAEAIYRFDRATKKRPTPQAFVNAANTQIERNDFSRAPGILRKGQVEFPNSAQIRNNLAVALMRNGTPNEAVALLQEDIGQASWNKALTVNKWTILADSISLSREYALENAALRTNILAQYAGKSDAFPFPVDTAMLAEPPNLHRYTYLINALWTSQETIPPGLVAAYLESARHESLGKNLRHAGVANQYKTGNVNQAVQSMRYLQDIANPMEQGFFLNQLGLLLLDQGAPRQAFEYFQQARDAGNEEAFFHGLIALLEWGQWGEAAARLNVMVTKDSAYIDLQKSFEPILNRSPNSSFAYTYYRIDDFTPEDIAERMTSLTDPERRMILERIIERRAPAGQLQELEEYVRVFNGLLDVAVVDLYQDKIAGVTEGLNPNPRNAFDVPGTLAVVYSDSYSDEEKYHILLEAININLYSPALLKAFCVQAVDAGFGDYAGPALLRLNDLVTPEEFNNFEHTFHETVEARESAEWTF